MAKYRRRKGDSKLNIKYPQSQTTHHQLRSNQRPSIGVDGDGSTVRIDFSRFRGLIFLRKFPSFSLNFRGTFLCD
ncbi:hypothetical protein V6N13_025059 [Hibiscus sabdariffa]|uniref:Uncharacterized protein n=2 Tax=Hibiscus sabdariffa TaxID=183260 RepID=A0ABR2BBA5_9ROSI